LESLIKWTDYRRDMVFNLKWIQGKQGDDLEKHTAISIFIRYLDAVWREGKIIGDTTKAEFLKPCNQIAAGALNQLLFILTCTAGEIALNGIVKLTRQHSTYDGAEISSWAERGTFIFINVGTDAIVDVFIAKQIGFQCKNRAVNVRASEVYNEFKRSQALVPVTLYTSSINCLVGCGFHGYMPRPKCNKTPTSTFTS
jgi:hypothetical protein